ncbi:MAG: arginine--tRNA ligase [Candidatus Vogelbacteria bacterium]|nr:arginine--tRNA ligase [Candidatus Vogelbacteria bacterium]
MNALAEFNRARELEIKRVSARVIEKRASRGYVPHAAYFLPSIELQIKKCLMGSIYEGEEILFSFIDTEKFGADISIRLPGLLKVKGAALYAEEVVPKLLVLFAQLALENPHIGHIAPSGMYINVSFTDVGLFSSLATVQETKDADGIERYGDADIFADQTAVCEYSSPNVAKHLHAGHIRSTIVGESLSRIYEAAGYTVQRINHINDWGGFGFVLEGWDRWHAEPSRLEDKNEELYQIYLRYRLLEKDGGLAWDEFKARADARFRALESGDPETVRRWQEMVGWSRSEFDSFYARFGISFDHTIGESFFPARGQSIVEKGLAAGTVVNHDGAAVVPLEDDEYLVVRRSDGASVYATRDLAAIQYRISAFNPRKIAYVVGEEQSAYFRQLFRAAREIGIVDGTERSLVHVALGLYVDAATGAKLSSRGGAGDVFSLLEAAREHFAKKYASRAYAAAAQLSREEIEANADMLARGSIIFNDLRKDRVHAVDLDPDTNAMLGEFEESGGAYVMYALARARGIIRKYGKKVETARSIETLSLENDERALVKKLLQFPDLVLKAERTDNPGIIGNFVFELARDYQSNYARYPVLADGGLAAPHRLVITHAVRIVLERGLYLLGIESPNIL